VQEEVVRYSFTTKFFVRLYGLRVFTLRLGHKVRWSEPTKNHDGHNEEKRNVQPH